MLPTNNYPTFLGAMLLILHKKASIERRQPINFMGSTVSQCVHGAWYAGACRCYKFWTARTCDQRLCARGAAVAIPYDGLCRCRPRFGGKFCQYEVCLHEDRWFCNTTEMIPPTIWDMAEERQIRAPELCSDQTLHDWFRVPDTITPSSYCNCSSGYREVLSNNGTAPTMSPVCTCPSTHFGRFCEQTNRSGADEFVEGFFGYDINFELHVAMTIAVVLIATFVLIAKWYLYKVDKQTRALRQAARQTRHSQESESKDGVIAPPSGSSSTNHG